MWDETWLPDAHTRQCSAAKLWLQQVFTPTKWPRTDMQVQCGKDLVAAGDHNIETFALMGGSTPPWSSQTRSRAHRISEAGHYILHFELTLSFTLKYLYCTVFELLLALTISACVGLCKSVL